MIITGAFFAEYARNNNGTLDVLGGVWDFYQTDRLEPDYFHNLRLVALVQAQPDDGEIIDITVESFGPSGAESGGGKLKFRFPAGAENGFIIPMLRCGFVEPGRHSFLIHADSGPTFSLPLDVRLVHASNA